MIKFLSFKSKAFISLYSLDSFKRTAQRKISILQQYIIVSNNAKFYYISNSLHREEKNRNNLVLPAYTNLLVSKTIYYKNNKQHREDKDKNGYSLPAIEYKYYEIIYMKNGKKHRDLEDKDCHGNTLPAYYHVDQFDNIYEEWCYKGKLYYVDKNKNDFFNQYAII